MSGECRKVLLVRPVNNNYTPPERDFFEALSFSMGLPIKDAAFRVHSRVVDLGGVMATREEFERSFELHPDIDLVVFLGHGEALGRFVRGYTRGDGVTGEDISANIATIKELPLSQRNGNFPFLSVRGEVFMTHSEFERLNFQACVHKCRSVVRSPHFFF